MSDSKKYEDSILAKWLVDSLDQEEFLLFNKNIKDKKINKHQLEEYKLVWDASANIEVPEGTPPKKRWEKLKVLISEKYNIGVRTKYRRLFWRYAAAAAIITLLIGSGITYLITNKKIIFEVPYAQTKTILLPDNSEVIINSGSSLEYKSLFWKLKRKVIVDGEAFFKVTKTGAPFSVLSSFATTEVLGTSFNIRSRDSKVKVSCLSGKIKVFNNKTKSSSTVLETGEGSTFYKTEPPSSTYKIDNNIIGWTKGILYFDKIPLNEVFTEFERHYNVKIEPGQESYNLSYTGQFENMSIEEVLEIVCLSADLEYSYADNQVFKIH